ncbi:Dyggve-Melchior-Clausen syndrome protein-domain-containing protein [Halteromyces radiatus]|uniref:Dyggve-Melchior-Clausen syndrome protein-domain-containing protein n=1 Tax=Halteromyces radiatus TaxID=101107 RepID=UPI0022208C6F|nr:Dyggve-Melchior-Clausen syndrome protein-domain-containing protein [Halteromyces radiatus]KAI8086427.1 Dyggve-Melchior-Clausen syndrome protein-domain-containing protein [Halteromyces radiatus]
MNHSNPPALTAPNRTLLTSDKHSFRRPSLYQNNSSSPVSPSSPSYLQRSPSTELTESFTALSSSLSSSTLSSNKPLPVLPPAATTTTTTTTSTTTTATTAAATSSTTVPISSPPLRNPTHHYLNTTQTASLKSLCSPNSIDIMDMEYWTSLLESNKFPATHTPQDTFDLEMDTVGLSIDLAAHNITTKNFNKLILLLINQLVLLQNDQTIPISTYNALFLVRVFSKHFIGNLSNDEIIRQFEGNCLFVNDQTIYLNSEKSPILPQVINDKRSKAEQLLDSIITLIINLDANVNYSIYEFYVELLNTLLVLLSTQLHRTKLEESNYFLDLLMTQFRKYTHPLLAKLLDNTIEQQSPPAQSTNVVYNAYNYFFTGRSSSADVDPLPVADRSLLLILLLSTQSQHCRNAIAEWRDIHMLSSDIDSHKGKTHLISFKDLFDIFCRSLHIEERMLLFYLILVENESFRVYVLSRTDPETLYIPILKMIYESIENRTNFSQVYMLLIILLIFSQDDVNNETIQKVMVHNLTWFTERPLLKSVSLGSLTMLVLIRTLQFNLSHQKDIYFHTNCLAILANMSASILDMHAYVAQRLTGVFELIARRYQKWTAKILETGQVPQTTVDIGVYEDLLMLMLEIINSALTHRLKHNSQLVYALILKRDLFIQFRLQPRFSQVTTNIENVINYFHSRVAEANLKSPSTSDVLDLIEQAARTWPSNRLQPMADLKFQYEEEKDSNEFFVPYVWALIHRRSFIYWSEEKAHILELYRSMNAQDIIPDEHQFVPTTMVSASTSSTLSSSPPPPPPPQPSSSSSSSLFT